MGFNVCIAGATGNVGRTMIQILEERNFPVDRIRLLASSRSVGKTLPFRGADIAVEEPLRFEDNLDPVCVVLPGFLPFCR